MKRIVGIALLSVCFMQCKSSHGGKKAAEPVHKTNTDSTKILGPQTPEQAADQATALSKDFVANNCENPDAGTASVCDSAANIVDAGSSPSLSGDGTVLSDSLNTLATNTDLQNTLQDSVGIGVVTSIVDQVAQNPTPSTETSTTDSAQAAAPSPSSPSRAWSGELTTGTALLILGTVAYTGFLVKDRQYLAKYITMGKGRRDKAQRVFEILLHPMQPALMVVRVVVLVPLLLGMAGIQTLADRVRVRKALANTSWETVERVSSDSMVDVIQGFKHADTPVKRQTFAEKYPKLRRLFVVAAGGFDFTTEAQLAKNALSSSRTSEAASFETPQSSRKQFSQSRPFATGIKKVQTEQLKKFGKAAAEGVGKLASVGFIIAGAVLTAQGTQLAEGTGSDPASDYITQMGQIYNSVVTQ